MDGDGKCAIFGEIQEIREVEEMSIFGSKGQHCPILTLVLSLSLHIDMARSRLTLDSANVTNTKSVKPTESIG
jgi:hypothetical protein